MTEEERETAKKKPVCHKKVEDCPETYDLGGGSEVLLNKEVGLYCCCYTVIVNC